ncbi:ZIP family metal transporter [Allosalinactinospora lopnorensis]|uniref:ZIP family metal transporter n=1 Tax=Allosalinactinospora lopnorensis TaxID=1352348 RepID=UPI00191C2B0B|nr:ZIP family metal transporter [Allosalinactinospora lopnorensis]
MSGFAMSALALVGSVTLLLSDRAFKRVVLPLVAMAAGALLGGVLFHMLPESVRAFDNSLVVYVWVAVGLFSFFVLEQFLHWHHCHRPDSSHRPLGHLVLVADGLHNLIGGLAVGGAFVVDVRLGVVTWPVAAAHEVPQELGDFGILLHSGWALAYNFLSALTFVLGGVLAYAASSWSMWRCWCHSPRATSSTSPSRIYCQRSPRPRCLGRRSFSVRVSRWG